MLRFESRHCLWKSVTQSLDHLEQREIDVGNLLAENEVAAFWRRLLEFFQIAEEFRDAVRAEIGGALFGLVRLLLIVQNVRVNTQV
jgi:hypothetical protein